MTVNEKAELSKLIIDHAFRQHPNMFAACSFGKDSRVIVDLVMEIRPETTFVGIDTGYEFPETLAYADNLVEEVGMKFEWVWPTEEDRQAIEKAYGDSFVLNDQYKCCEMKIPAIERAFAKYDGWITGLRRDETEMRKNIPPIEEGKITKVNPIAFWNSEDVWEYIKSRELSYHPLYDQGYKSLGCKPCTTTGKVRVGGGRQGQFERAGRFAGANNNSECGLHTM